MFKSIIIIFVILLSNYVVAGNADRKVREAWICGAILQPITSVDDILLEPEVFNDAKTGVIHLSSFTYDAAFELEGLKRVWQFGQKITMCININ
jgi:hypothetical protein